MSFRKKLTNQDRIIQAMLWSPESKNEKEIEQDLIKRGIIKKVSVPRKTYAHDEKDFMQSILKICRDYYKAGIKHIWMARNNVGMGRAMHSDAIIKYGLGVGTSDLIGYHTVTITPDMVGQKIARFMAIETKANTKASEAQQMFVDQVNRDGGLAIIARERDGLEFLHKIVN